MLKNISRIETFGFFHFHILISLTEMMKVKTMRWELHEKDFCKSFKLTLNMQTNSKLEQFQLKPE